MLSLLKPDDPAVEPRAPETRELSRLRGRWVIGESGRPEMRWDIES